MSRLVFILSVSIGSVVIGYIVRKARIGSFHIGERATGTISKYIKIISIFVLNLVPVIDSFWKLPLNTGRLFVFPLLGVASLIVGGGAVIVINRVFHIEPKQAASMFTAGMFSNIITFGGLTAFVFFGYQGYVLVQLFNMLIPFCNYSIGFPMSERISRGGGVAVALSPRVFREQPYLFAPIAAMVVGLVLDLGGLRVPHLLDAVSSVLIPVNSGLLGFSIGLTLSLGKVGRYPREIALISFVKFIAVPAIMIPIGVALGLPALLGGVPFKVLVIVSLMPVAFNALVPPAVYGFDLDLANSAWIVTTLALLVIIPVLYGVFAI